MKCPYCNEEMELGIIKIDDPGIVLLVYQSAEDAEKKGLKQRRSVNPTVFFVNRNTIQ